MRAEVFLFTRFYCMIMLMEQVVICVILAVFGLCMGSFAGAMVWRLRARQLQEDKAAGEKVNNREYKKLLPLTHATVLNDRSRCLHCGHVLKWFDLFPLASWISVGGKCRYCHTHIGRLEPVIELGMAALFVGSYLLWPEPLQTPLQAAHFLLWLVAGMLLVILFVYDLKWSLLPNYVVFPLIAVAAAIAVLQLVDSSDVGLTLINILMSVMILSGLYLALWALSKGQWIGFGDVKLGLGLALLLSDWQLAFIALFAANLIGCIIVVPGMLMGKITRKSRVPFGPLLIGGYLIATFFGYEVISWYFSTFLAVG